MSFFFPRNNQLENIKLLIGKGQLSNEEIEILLDYVIVKLQKKAKSQSISIVKTSTQIDDCWQDALTNIAIQLKKGKIFENIEQFNFYVLKANKNFALLSLRKDNPNMDSLDIETEAITENYIDVSWDKFDSKIALFEKIGSKCIELLLMRFHVGYDIKEMAEQKNLLPNSVTMQLKRCLESLKNKYSKNNIYEILRNEKN